MKQNECIAIKKTVTDSLLSIRVAYTMVIILIILAIVLRVWLIYESKESISGVWERDVCHIRSYTDSGSMYFHWSTERFTESSSPLTIEFDRNSFIVSREIVVNQDNQVLVDEFMNILWDGQPRHASYSMALTNVFESDIYDVLSFVGTIQTSARESHQIYYVQTRGAYSLLEHGDLIEFILADGSVYVGPILHEDEAITIGWAGFTGHKLTRQVAMPR